MPQVFPNPSINNCYPFGGIPPIEGKISSIPNEVDKQTFNSWRKAESMPVPSEGIFNKKTIKIRYNIEPWDPKE